MVIFLNRPVKGSRALVSAVDELVSKGIDFCSVGTVGLWDYGTVGGSKSIGRERGSESRRLGL